MMDELESSGRAGLDSPKKNDIANIYVGFQTRSWTAGYS
jgi:hypothetical protein